MAEHQRSLPDAALLSAGQAQAVVNRFLLSQAGSVFSAGTPELEETAQCWDVPILYNPPDYVAGIVGQAQVSACTGSLERHTSIPELHAHSAELHARKKAQIHTTFLRARKK